jgi:exosortase
VIEVMSTNGSLLFDAVQTEDTVSAATAPARLRLPDASQRWNTVSAIAAAIVLVGVSVGLARQAWHDLVFIGKSDPESSHVLLVPVVFLWLAWHRRHRLKLCESRHRWVGTLAIALGWILWSTGYRFSIQVFWHSGAVLMALGAFLTVAGADLLWAFLPAFGALIFLLPVPGTGRELVALPLQRVTAHATQITAELVGINIQRTGSLLRINGVDVAIAEACNGMRMVFTLLLACYVFAFVTPLRWPVRLLILILSPLVAVATNVVRLVPTVWAYGHASREAAERFHDATGWAMLVVAFLGLMGFVRVLRWAGVSVDPPSERFV